MNNMIQPTDKLDVTLEAQQWDVVLRLLAEGPFRVVQPLISEIQRQCMAAVGPPARDAED